MIPQWVTSTPQPGRLVSHPFSSDEALHLYRLPTRRVCFMYVPLSSISSALGLINRLNRTVTLDRNASRECLQVVDKMKTSVRRRKEEDYTLATQRKLAHFTTTPKRLITGFWMSFRSSHHPDLNGPRGPIVGTNPRRIPFAPDCIWRHPSPFSCLFLILPPFTCVFLMCPRCLVYS